MKKIYFLFLIAIFITNCSTAQKTTSTTIHSEKPITLEDIWKNWTFSTKRLNSFDALKNGDYYCILNFDRKTGNTTLDKYSYKTLDKVETIINSTDFDNLISFSDYRFSKDETKVIIGTNAKQIYRHSSKAKYYVYDITSKKIEEISKDYIQEPTFSPDGKKIAFSHDNNLYVKNLKNNKTTQITFDGEKNKIINGTTDWVYEEEFAFVRAFEWNNDSSKLAFIRFDESDVPEFSMDIFGKELYPSQQIFKYPKAGEKNATVSLYMYNFTKHKSEKVNLNNAYYIPRIKWSNNTNTLCVTTLNRHQNNLNLVFVNAKNLKTKKVLTETDDAYVDVTDNLTFLDDNSFIWTSEKDGYNHIYHYNENGLINQVTKGKWEVTNYYGLDKKTNRIFYQSTQDGSINRAIYSIGLDGKNAQKLNEQIGNNSAKFSNSFNYYVNTFSNAITPTIYSLNNAKTGKTIKEIINNKAVAEKFSNYTKATKEFSTISVNGNDLNMWMIKPANFDESKKYPLLMYQYSGPGSQQVSNRWNSANDNWYYMLAQKGYIVACVDGRGTGFKGRDFKKITQKELGKYEIQDQIDAAKLLGQRNYIDAERIGIWGWSFGGYMSSLAITKGADTFKMAIAVAPVTNWRYYDTIYTERYMQTPQENANGYDDNSPINFVNLLKGNYLLIHGTGDDNVHVQNTMQMINALVKANKQFDLFVFPDRTHGIYSTRNDRLFLYQKMTNFLDQNL